jgi:hypothetical protein
MRKQIYELVKKNSLPVDCEHLINLALIDKQTARDRKGLNLDTIDAYFTQKDHIAELKKILKRFNMNPDLLN